MLEVGRMSQIKEVLQFSRSSTIDLFKYEYILILVLIQLQSLHLGFKVIRS